MRADIHEGPEHTLQSEAGYIDARPHRRDRRNLLHRTAGPYKRVKTGSADRFAGHPRTRPVYLNERTWLAARRYKPASRAAKKDRQDPDLKSRHTAPTSI